MAYSRAKRMRGAGVFDRGTHMELEVSLRYEDVQARQDAQSSGFTWNAEKKVWRKPYRQGTYGKLIADELALWQQKVAAIEANPPAPVPYVKKDVADATRARVAELEAEVRNLRHQLQYAQETAAKAAQEQDEKVKVFVGKCPGCGEEVYLKSTELREVEL